MGKFFEGQSSLLLPVFWINTGVPVKMQALLKLKSVQSVLDMLKKLSPSSSFALSIPRRFWVEDSGMVSQLLHKIVFILYLLFFIELQDVECFNSPIAIPNLLSKLDIDILCPLQSSHKEVGERERWLEFIQ